MTTPPTTDKLRDAVRVVLQAAGNGGRPLEGTMTAAAEFVAAEKLLTRWLKSSTTGTEGGEGIDHARR